MSDTRIIKKYPNRRLYDTEISRYITLEEVRQLVLQNVKFKVLDKSNDEEITQADLVMEYFTSHPNRDIPHSEIVPWLTSEYEKRNGKPFADPDRQIRMLSQKGFLQ